MGEVTTTRETDWVTVPQSRGCELVLASVRYHGDPAGAVMDALSDPTNYAHVLDFRSWSESDD